MGRLPEGTTTFMLTDLQGSTRTRESQPKAMRAALTRHDAILATAVGNHKGQLVEAGREGDSVLAVFKTAATAASCALDIQDKFAIESWPGGLDVKVRVALNTGEAELRDGHYLGPALNRCARLLAACHPGQILVTKATESMLADEIPQGAELVDLGLHQFKDLARPEHVFQLNHLARATEFPPIQSVVRQKTNVPNQMTTFVGRGSELVDLQSLLTDSRLVTLTGAGGAGKTRLAAELARACLALWPEGVWWVDLAQVADSDQVPGAVVAALELPGRGPALDVILSWLVTQRTVLILDNCEHLIAACARLCEAALRRCPQLTIIATSREALGVYGEARWPVSSLNPADALQLFEARARLVVRDFRITTSNTDAVTEICQRIDNMPLAIELAAARAGVLTEHEILNQLSDRFHLLSGGHRTAPERQRTMTATIDWSYRLLTEDEASLFRRLSVFRGGFTLDSAEAVCEQGDSNHVLDVLIGLIEKSMVVAERLEDSSSRYRLLESQLAYGEDRLREADELEPVRRRHYEYFRGFMAAAARDSLQAQPPLDIPKRRSIVRESGNLWAALEWARNNADDMGLSLAADFEIRDVSQARRLLEDLLARSPAKGSPRTRALGVASFYAWVQGDFRAAFQFAERSVALARDQGDSELLAVQLNLLGMAHQGNGELAAAAEIYEEASALVKDANTRPWVVIRNSLGLVAIHRGDYTAAANILAGCVTAAKARGDAWLYAACLDSLACAQLGLNQIDAAAASWKEVLPMCRDFLDDLGIALGLQGLTCVASARGDDARALRLAAAASGMITSRSLGGDAWLLTQVEDAQRRSRTRLGTPMSDEAWNQGSAMTVEQAIEYAIGEDEPETVIDPGPLSRRQREVARLVAAGLTNREIAERLFIAERSAEGHVERIRNKLGVRSRIEVATWAVEHGLTAIPIKERGTRVGPPSAQQQQPS